jgi:hypothetical protein
MKTHRPLLLGAFVLAGAAISACSSGSGATSFLGNFQTTNTSTIAINQSGSSVALPNAADYSGTLTYPSNNSSGATATLTTTTNATAVPNPQPTGTILVYFTVNFSQTITFNSSVVLSPVNLPPTVNTAGHTFYNTVYDTTAGMQLGPAQAGTLQGNSINFPSGGSSVTLTGNHNYVVVISYT